MVSGFERRSDIVAVARRLYKRAPAKARVLQSLRPYICPFDDLLRWVPDQGTILDVGCGAGLFLGLLASVRPQVRAVGFDADPAAIAAAQGMARAHFEDGRVNFRCSAVGQPWPEGLFDVVSMVDVLHHIPPGAQRAAISESFAHVRAGGIFIYKDMTDRNLLRAWWNRVHDLILAQQWIHYRPVTEVEDWLRRSGAQILERSKRSMGPYGHELLVALKPA